MHMVISLSKVITTQNPGMDPGMRLGRKVQVRQERTKRWMIVLSGILCYSYTPLIPLITTYSISTQESPWAKIFNHPLLVGPSHLGLLVLPISH